MTYSKKHDGTVKASQVQVGDTFDTFSIFINIVLKITIVGITTTKKGWIRLEVEGDMGEFGLSFLLPSGTKEPNTIIY